jgi:hypothetical protein
MANPVGNCPAKPVRQLGDFWPVLTKHPLAAGLGPVVCFAVLSLFVRSADGGSEPTARLDSAWAHYYNAEARYCVSYPQRWYKSDAFDGSGLYVMSGPKKHARATGEIDVALFHEADSHDAHAANVSLKDSYESHVEGLKKFERAERMELLEQHPVNVAGVAGLFTKDKYYDPQDRSNWIEEVIFVEHAGDVYRLELECKADQVSRFEPVFSHLAQSFQFECGEPRGSN